MLMKRYILWDNDGVLVDTEQWYFKATQRALAELGVQLDLATYQARMVRGASSWDLAAQAGIAPEQIAAKRFQRDACYQAYLADETIAIPGVEEVLAKLAGDSGVKMAIVTTSMRAHFELIHGKSNLLRLWTSFSLVKITSRRSRTLSPTCSRSAALPPAPTSVSWWRTRSADCKLQSPPASTALWSTTPLPRAMISPARPICWIRSRICLGLLMMRA
jgi:hypothetical protein